MPRATSTRKGRATGSQNGAQQAIEEALRGRDPAELKQLYQTMLLIRRFEERTAEQYTRARIGGYCHLNIGEEASVVGTMSALRPTDYVFTGYREHGYAIARGLEPRAVMAELFGKDTGVVRGRGGSMHLYQESQRFMGGYGIVGGHLPLAVGAAMAIEYRKRDDVVLCVFGEGATNIGAFHEALNMAQLWRLPVVFVCTNNLYAMGAPIHKDSAVTEVWRKAQAYDMHSDRVDGMDVIAVQDCVAEAIRMARDENYPAFIETVTYRFRGHSMADAAKSYRTEEEVQQWKEHDPITWFAQRLQSANLITDEELAAAEAEANRIVADAVQFAEESPLPPLEDLEKYVLAEE